MKKILVGLALTLVIPGLATAASKDDPILSKVMIDQLEVRSTDGPDPWVLDAQAWIGQDLNKVWFKTEDEKVGSETEEAQ